MSACYHYVNYVRAMLGEEGIKKINEILSKKVAKNETK